MYTRWPAATAADPEKKSWLWTSINFAGPKACRALRKAKVYRKSCFECRKLHPKSVPGSPKTLLATLRRTLVEPWFSQPLGKRRGACGLQRIAHPPADAPVAQLPHLCASPPPPKLYFYPATRGSLSPRPHTPRRGRRIRDGLRPLPPTPKRNLGFQLPIQGLSSSPKSKGVPKVVLGGPKMAPEIGSWEPQNSPSRPEAHPGRCPGTPPSASRLRWRGYLKITRFSHGQTENYR